MAREITSKNIDGITDLVVIAPIKEGFIRAFENVTYATRLKVVAEALNRIRVSAREHEETTPFSDVTERILTLLDFRIGVLDKDLFSLSPENETGSQDSGLKSRRYLYLTATFDGAWEPYMRLIWDPLGPFLDLLFCNCEGYVTAVDHSFDEFAQWVRDNQMDSAIFYATTGLTIRDHLYLNRLEQIQRKQSQTSGAALEIARLTVPNPEEAAKAERNKALGDIALGDLAKYRKIHELALEALTVLYRLADFYPPEWFIDADKTKEEKEASGLKEGRYLARAAHSILAGWEDLIPKDGKLLALWNQTVVPTYGPILRWYFEGKAYVGGIKQTALEARPKDPDFDLSQVQGGILKSLATKARPIRQGALLLMSIVNAGAARKFINNLKIHFDGAENASADPSITIAFTPYGLRRIGLPTDVIDHFPKEFREGMEMRSGILGDMRENHPRRWTLPSRNWPPVVDAAGNTDELVRPPVELSEVDLVIQIRTTEVQQNYLDGLIKKLAGPGKDGVVLLSVEHMVANYNGETGEFIDHFGFRDGISQPKPKTTVASGSPNSRDDVALGEVLLGYKNDRDDFAPLPFESLAPWRQTKRKIALEYQLNGTFLVIRKLEQDVGTFEAFIKDEVSRINKEYPTLTPQMTADKLKAKLLGRWPNGEPLIPAADGSLNNFDYSRDQKGDLCPFASHVRRTNPRNTFQGRPSPRILRRGMLFGSQVGSEPVGLMFMAYNSSIAEQFETIQRWINGGNSTDIASGHNDPLLGGTPKSGELYPVERVFRFVENDQVISVSMPKAFVKLHWGQYFFVPSKDALAKLCMLESGYRVMDDPLENAGRSVIDRLSQLNSPTEEAKEWKRLLEDFDVKDPSEKDVSPDMWAAIRWWRGGAMRIDGMSDDKKKAQANLDPQQGIESEKIDWNLPPTIKSQEIILCAGRKQVLNVLKDWKNFTVEEQLRRIEPNSGPIFVAQQPDDIYKNTSFQGRFNHKDESVKTNAILMAFDRDWGFATGYAAAAEILGQAKKGANDTGRDYFKLELRRQFLMPALGRLFENWFGLPDEEHMFSGGWQWEPPTKRTPPGARCPGDFLSPSRNAFYPRPTQTVSEFADIHGKGILAACSNFVATHRDTEGKNTGPISEKMFNAVPSDEILARNLAGTLVGAIPPMEANLRSVLAEWLIEKTLWRHQANLRRQLGDKKADSNAEAAMDILFAPISQAMCKRPAPDLLYRTALRDTEIQRKDEFGPLKVKERDLVVVSLVSAAQRSLMENPEQGDVSIVFGGHRTQPDQSASADPKETVHACPAREIALGAMMGIMAALLDVGRIQALPASLIVKISDWKPISQTLDTPAA